ncbi:MAG TPA: protein translocase subunit SecF [bacterium]|nr:protein translocase subunit SecF [bacterium]
MKLLKETRFDFIGRRGWAYLFSCLIIAAGLTVFGIRGQKNFGPDFVGGDLLQIEISRTITAPEVSRSLQEFSGVTVQQLGTSGQEFLIRSAAETSAQLLRKLQDVYGSDAVKVKANTSIEPSMSASLRKKALHGLLWGILGILLYLTIRFEFRLATAATIAIFHDICFCVAVMALARQQIDATVVAAFLTVAGYSVNDTVIIFDRIRENLRKTRSGDYAEVFNRSINETLSRTIITVLSVLFVVVCLFFFGGRSLHSFSLVLLIGFIIGTYSSIFIASSLVIDWNRISPHRFRL